MVPEIASAETKGQAAETVPDHTNPEVSAVKQTAITDFFSPRPATSLAEVSVLGGNVSDNTREPSALPPFIKPCPSVRFSEVPVVFHVQSDCVVEDHLDPTRPLYKREALRPSPEPSSAETGSSLTKSGLDTLSPELEDLVSDTSNGETLFGSPAQDSVSSLPASPKSSREMPSDTSSSPSKVPATKLIDTSQAEDTKRDETQQDIEKYWVKKDEERLEVIANMEKTMAEMNGKLANAATAFQIASGANQGLQAELEKKTTSLSQMEEDMDNLVHNLDAADMKTEQLKKELAHNQRDRKFHFDRAEEAMTLIESDPTKDVVAKLLQAKAEAESTNIIQQREMESDMDYLRLQLKERCDSVVHLTMSLSRVADSDRWKEIKKEMEELNARAKNLPEELQGAWSECKKWKGQHDALWEKHQKLLVEQATLEDDFQRAQDSDMEEIRKLQRQLKNTAVSSERIIKGCLKQIFERLVRCSLYMESEGYLPFNETHKMIRERVRKLTGEDYQKALEEYYDEHDIRDEFTLVDEDDEEDGHDGGGDSGENAGGDNKSDDDEDEGDHDLNNEGQAGNGEPGDQANDKEHDEDPTGNHCNIDLDTSSIAVGPEGTTHDSCSAAAPVTTEDDNVIAATAKEEEVRESSKTQEARRKLGVTHSKISPDSFPTIANQAIPAVTSSSGVSHEHGDIASSDIVQTSDVLSPGETAEEAADSHLTAEEEDPVQVSNIDDAELSSTDNGGIRDESFENEKEVEVDQNRCEDRAVLREDSSEASYSTDQIGEGDNGTVRKASEDGIPEGSDETKAHQRNATSPPTPAGGNGPSERELLKPRVKKQAFSGRDSPVSVLAANTKPEPSEGFVFPNPSFASKPMDTSSISNSADEIGSDVGEKYIFGNRKNPPPSLFATPSADSKAKSGKGSITPDPLKTKPAEATRPSAAAEGNSQGIWGDVTFAARPSAAAKGNSQGIWGDVTFAAAENRPFLFNATPAVDLETKPENKSLVFKSFSTSQPAESKTPAFKFTEFQRGSEATKPPKEAAPGATKEARFPKQLQEFNFGQNGNAVSFTGSSPSLSGRSTQPASTEMFSFSGTSSPSMTSQATDKAAEVDVEKHENSKEDTLKTEGPKEGAPKKEAPKEEASEEKAPEEGTPTKEAPKEVTPKADGPEEHSPQEKTQKELTPKGISAPKVATPKKEDALKEAPSPSSPSRNQKRAAKKQEKKEAKKAEKEAKNANAQASRRVRQALMMR